MSIRSFYSPSIKQRNFLYKKAKSCHIFTPRLYIASPWRLMPVYHKAIRVTTLSSLDWERQISTSFTLLPWRVYQSVSSLQQLSSLFHSKQNRPKLSSSLGLNVNALSCIWLSAMVCSIRRISWTTSTWRLSRIMFIRLNYVNITALFCSCSFLLRWC